MFKRRAKHRARMDAATQSTGSDVEPAELPDEQAPPFHTQSTGSDVEPAQVFPPSRPPLHTQSTGSDVEQAPPLHTQSTGSDVEQPMQDLTHHTQSTGSDVDLVPGTHTQSTGPGVDQAQQVHTPTEPPDQTVLHPVEGARPRPIGTTRTPRIGFVMTCMGRADHALRTIARWLEHRSPHHQLVFVDWHCPDRGGDRVQQQFPAPGIHVVFARHTLPLPEGQIPIFNKPFAQNIGALRAIDAGCDYLVFLDADTLIQAPLCPWLDQNLGPDAFVIVEPFGKNLANKDLVGFLAIHQRHFFRVGGFDPEFLGWGVEDIDMRLRLFLQGRGAWQSSDDVLLRPHLYALPWIEIPVQFFEPIPHDDTRRVTHYLEKDKQQSHDQNLRLLAGKLYDLLDAHVMDLHDTPAGPYLRRLLGMEWICHPRSL